MWEAVVVRKRFFKFRYTQVLNVPFGGVHVVLVGDFLQVLPVNADPIYIDPADKFRASTADIEVFKLWRRFSTVVILEESVRFHRDPQWGDGCRHARLGQRTLDFIALINSRVLTPRDNGANLSTPSPPSLSPAAADATQSTPLQAGAGAVFVTPENVTRLAINSAFVCETAAMLPTDTYPIRVVANFKGAFNGLSHSDIRQVLSLPDFKLGRVAPYLDLIDGMLVQVTQNVATAKGVGNGTLGTLEYVHFPNRTHFRLVRDGASSTIVQLPSCAPDYAMLRVPRPRATAIRPGIDQELFPVFFATEAYKKATITLPKAPLRSSRSSCISCARWDRLYIRCKERRSTQWWLWTGARSNGW